MSEIPSATAAKNQETIDDAAKKDAYDAFCERGRNQLVSLNASTTDVLNFIKEASKNEERTPAWDMALQEMMSERNRMISMLSNVMRALADGISSIIKNIRA